MKIYRMIIARPGPEKAGDTTTRRTYTSPTQGKAPDGWICIGVIGYYEKPVREYHEEKKKAAFMP